MYSSDVQGIASGGSSQVTANSLANAFPRSDINGASNATNDTRNGAPRISAETSPAYYSTIYCVKTTEDSATSNTIWATSGNNVLLNNNSMNVNITSNLNVVGNTTLNQSVWIYPASLGGSWVNYGSGYSNFSYRKDSMGYLQLRGMIKSGGTGPSNAIINLSAAYRPTYNTEFMITASPSGGNAQIVILPTGSVYVEATTSNTWISFDGVSIPLD
jgi:hypothetical protein